jgi:LysR family transcriptional regulator, hydrogen peroxide-inducible genes activator
MSLKALPSARQLAYLIALVETGHFGRAAGKCAVTQSTLSAGLKELEALLGVRLVERTRRRVVVTPLGRAIAARGREALQYLEDLVDLARAGKSDLAGPLNLGVIPTVAPYVLPRLVAETAKAFPRAKLLVREEQTAPMLARLRGGELDLGLIALPYDTAGLDCAAIGEEDMVVCLRADHPLAARKSVREQDLANVPLLMLEDGHCLRDHALAACRIPAAALKEVFQATSLPTLVAMVAGGVGLTLLPRMAVERELAGRADLTVRPFERARPMRTLALAWRSAAAQGENYTRLAKALRDARLV